MLNITIYFMNFMNLRSLFHLREGNEKNLNLCSSLSRSFGAVASFFFPSGNSR